MRRSLTNRPSGQEGIPRELRTGKLKGHDMFEITIAELQAHLTARHFTAAEYTRFCLGRIHALNPYVEAVIETNPDAMSIAASLDRERDSDGGANAAAGEGRPLLGIPILLKDNIATADATHTTAGSFALLGLRPPRDAAVAARLRASGAVLLGKTNMSEWASLRSDTGSNGYSPRGGQTRNPYSLNYTPHGSSSGSAVAVSTGMVPAALGTETDTSIIGPAATNGIVAVKPTVGLTSRAGVVPTSESQDSVGVLARTVADAVAVLDAIVEVGAGDERDPWTTEAAGVAARAARWPYAMHLATREALQGARFGLPMKRCWEMTPPCCKAIAEQVFDAMRRAGAEIIEVDLPSAEERTNEQGTWDWKHRHAEDPTKSEWTVIQTEAYNGLNAYLRDLVGPENSQGASPGSVNPAVVRTFEAVVEFNKLNPSTEGGRPKRHPAFQDGQPNFLEIVHHAGRKDETYQAALRHIQSQTRENGIDAALRGDRLSDTGAVVAAPAGQQQLDALLFCDRLCVGQQYAAQAGYPIVCIPIGLDPAGMPVSLSLQHTAWREDALVRWASAIEDLLQVEMGWRDVPMYRNMLAKNIPLTSLEA